MEYDGALGEGESGSSYHLFHIYRYVYRPKTLGTRISQPKNHL